MKKNYHLKKKSQVMDLGLAILGAIIILVIIYLLYTFFMDVRDLTSIQTCRNSVQAQNLLIRTTKFDVFTDIKCPTRQIKLDASDGAKVKDTIAEDMHRCWYEWGGRENLTLFKGDGIFCHVCAIYSFKQPNAQVQGFSTYLASQNIPPRFPGDDPRLSYVDYFNGYAMPTSQALLDKLPSTMPQYLNPNDYLNTSNKYATMFVYVSSKNSLQKFFEGKGASFVTAGGLTFLAGSAAVATGTIATGYALVTTGTVVGAGALTIPVAGWIVGGAILLGTGALTVYLVYEAKTSEAPHWPFIIFMPYTSDNINNIGCEKLDVMQLSNTPTSTQQ